MKRVNQNEILRYCIEQHIPFVIYKFPNEEVNTLIVSKVVKGLDFERLFAIDEDVFTIAPFSLSEKETLCFKCDFVIDTDVEAGVFEHIKKIKPQKETLEEKAFCGTYADYKRQFESLFSEIESGRISKAILSRIKHIDGLGTDLAADFYYKLSSTYPKAYTFMVYTPQSGLWTGASPELLFKAVDGEGTTVSLAGTRKNNSSENGNWNAKELDEQQIVTDFVTGVLSKHGIKASKINGPETIVAGKMSHLKTQYSFDMGHLSSELGSFVSDLHPTPAVCGLPKQASMEVIQEVEQHQRTYYAGFLGRIKKDDIRLFVNIRSMKFVETGVDLYLGGGITKGSESDKEWQETELKAGTMLSVINAVVEEEDKQD